MEMKHKCNYCNALLSETNSVFVHINRYDNIGRSSRQLWMCCKCWDNTQISVPYLEEDPESKKEVNDIYGKGGIHLSGPVCGNCSHLIFKDYKHCEGFCDKLRISRRFHYPCIHEEEMS